MEPGITRLLLSRLEHFEQGAVPRLAEMGEFKSYRNEEFWQFMDILRERNELTSIALLAPPLSMVVI